MLPPERSPQEAAKHFPSTCWTLIRAAQGTGDEATARGCFEQLTKIYWYSAYVFFRSRGSEPERSRFLTQQFFANLFDRKAIGRLGSEQVRFRIWLHAALTKFLSVQSTSSALLPSPVDSLCLDDAERRFRAEGDARGSPENQYERAWAAALLERATRRLSLEYEKAGKAALAALIIESAAAEGAPGRVSSVTGPQKIALARGRLRLWELVREEVAESLDLTGATVRSVLIETELQALRAALALSAP